MKEESEEEELEVPKKKKKVAKEEEDSEDEISEDCPFDSDEEINQPKSKVRKGKTKASLQHRDIFFEERDLDNYIN